jgi:hypothetical protein
LAEQSRVPPNALGEFVARIKDVLAVSHRPCDERQRQVCRDDVPV